jgi:hypothetical protein
MATARQRWNQLERRLWHAIRRADQVDVIAVLAGLTRALTRN